MAAKPDHKKLDYEWEVKHKLIGITIVEFTKRIKLEELASLKLQGKEILL